MGRAQESMSSEDFLRATVILSENKDSIRERVQEITSKEIKNIIDKLESNKPLSTEDMQCMGLWIVGDAESYTELENNFRDWLDEFKRLGIVLEQCENRELSLNELFKLQGTLEDTIRVAADIGNFLEKKERIKKFQEATKNIANLDKEIIITILTEKLKSPKL